jgi:hypothetical protein
MAPTLVSLDKLRLQSLYKWVRPLPVNLGRVLSIRSPTSTELIVTILADNSREC